MSTDFAQHPGAGASQEATNEEFEFMFNKLPIHTYHIRKASWECENESKTLPLRHMHT